MLLQGAEALQLLNSFMALMHVSGVTFCLSLSVRISCGVVSIRTLDFAGCDLGLASIIGISFVVSLRQGTSCPCRVYTEFNFPKKLFMESCAASQRQSDYVS